MKKGMKQTPLGEIPVDWQVVKADEVFESISDKGHPHEELLSVTQDKGIIPRSQLEARVVMPEGTTAGYKLVKRGDFVISLRSFQGGLEWTNYQGLVSPAYTVIRRKQPMNDGFLSALFKEEKFIERLSSSVVGSRDGKQINFRDFKHVYIQVPPLPEQQKIAEILSTVDEQIANIDQQLAQTQELKKGLMQRLLTKGIGHTAFKDSPLGRVPESWQLNTLQSITENYNYKRIPIKSDDREKRRGPFPYYGAQGIIDHVDSFIFEGEYLLIAEDGQNLRTRRNDIAFVVTGRFWVNNHAHIVKANGAYSIILLKYFLNYLPLKGAVSSADLPKLNQNKLNKLLIPTPPLSEQYQIAEILTTVDDKLGVLVEKKTHYQTLKKGLMQQLLTGQRRVRVADPVAVEA